MLTLYTLLFLGTAEVSTFTYSGPYFTEEACRQVGNATGDAMKLKGATFVCLKYLDKPQF